MIEEEKSVEDVKYEKAWHLTVFNITKEDYNDFIEYTKNYAGRKGSVALRQLLQSAKIQRLEEENSKLKQESSDRKEIKTLGKKKEEVD